MRVVLWVGWLLLALVGCQSDESSGDGGETCSVTEPVACPSDMPTYADVEPILQERCVSCHLGEGQSELCETCWGLTNYDEVTNWTHEIQTSLLECAMPPPESGVTMTDAERLTILEWIRCGAPR